MGGISVMMWLVHLAVYLSFSAMHVLYAIGSPDDSLGFCALIDATVFQAGTLPCMRFAMGLECWAPLSWHAGMSLNVQPEFRHGRLVLRSLLYCSLTGVDKARRRRVYCAP